MSVLPALLFLAACHPAATVQTPPAPAPGPTYGLPADAGVTCKPVWIPLETQGIIAEYDYACNGWSPTGVVQLSNGLWIGQAWSAATSRWVQVTFQPVPLAAAQAGVMAFLTPRSSAWHRCWAEFGACRGVLIFGVAYPIWILGGNWQ